MRRVRSISALYEDGIVLISGCTSCVALDLRPFITLSKPNGGRHKPALFYQ